MGMAYPEVHRQLVESARYTVDDISTCAFSELGKLDVLGPIIRHEEFSGSYAPDPFPNRVIRS